MIPCNHLKTPGPSVTYITTYSRDYRPFSLPRPRTEAPAAPAFISTPRTYYETCPELPRDFYKTSNSIYGSWLPSCPLVSSSVGPSGVPAPNVSEACGVVTSGATSGTEPLPSVEETGHQPDVSGGNVSEQQGAKDEPQQTTDEGLPGPGRTWNPGDEHSAVDPACCEGFVRCLLREAGLQNPLRLSVTSGPIITTTDAENWANYACSSGSGPAIVLNYGSFHQPTSGQCSCCCFTMQNFPPCIHCGGTVPLAHVQPTFYHPQPSRKLTEYQANYAAEWARPNMQQCDAHPLRHCILHPSF